VRNALWSVILLTLLAVPGQAQQMAASAGTELACTGAQYFDGDPSNLNAKLLSAVVGICTPPGGSTNAGSCFGS
jgi:hypothetical protein